MRESITPEDVTKLARSWVAFARSERREMNDARTLERVHSHGLRSDQLTQRTFQLLTSLLDFTHEQAYDFMNGVWNQLDAAEGVEVL